MSVSRTLAASVAALLGFCQASHALEFRGLAQAAAVSAEDRASFIDGGTGDLRFSGSGLEAQQLVLEVTHDISSSLSARVVANGYADGDQRVGVSQALLLWKPPSQQAYRFKGRAGFFYPRFSSESTDVGWLSPYTYTPSAINSWLGEELRVLGAELSVFSPGRSRRSPWSWEATGALFCGNDPTGTLLAWRGFALHDRQALERDRVHFAPIPSVTDANSLFYAPAWVEPFREVDQRVGAYVGIHARHRGGYDVRVYRYDNNANDAELNRDRLYAWHTNFTSVALSHRLNRRTQLLTQGMSGRTTMGEGLVGANFVSYYGMVTHRREQNRFTARFDYWDVEEDDPLPSDPNDSSGEAWTLSYRNDVSERWQLGVEFTHSRSSAANRALLNLPIGQTQQQWMAVVQYRWGE